MSTNGKFNTKIQRKKKNPSEINANYCTKVMLQRKTSKAEVIGSHKREKKMKYPTKWERREEIESDI